MDPRSEPDTQQPDMSQTTEDQNPTMVADKEEAIMAEDPVAIKRPGMPQWKWKCAVLVFAVTSLCSGSYKSHSPSSFLR